MEAAGCWVGPGLGAEMETSARTHGASQVAVVVRNLPANADDIRDMGSIPGLARDMGLIPGGGHGNPLQYSCLENPYGQRSLWAVVHSGAESRT